MMNMEIDPETNMPKVPSDMSWEVVDGGRELIGGYIVHDVRVEVKLVRTVQVDRVRKWDEMVTEVIEVPRMWFWTKKVSETHEVPRAETYTEELQYVQSIERMYRMKDSRSTTEPGWVSAYGHTRQDSPLRTGRATNYWFKPEELTDENVQMAAIRCLTKYWERAYEEAVEQDRQRTSNRNRDRILGKYGPQKLELGKD